MAAQIEVDVSGDKIEYAYGLAKQMQEQRYQLFADIGMRAARARDEKMLKVMEKATEYIHGLSEDQMGRTRRSTSNYGETAEHTELGLWREAYRMMDKGEPMEQFQWIYGAAAWICGYIVRPTGHY